MLSGLRLKGGSRDSAPGWFRTCDRYDSTRQHLPAIAHGTAKDRFSSVRGFEESRSGEVSRRTVAGPSPDMAHRDGSPYPRENRLQFINRSGPRSAF
jgi:hypothetical protein